MIEGTPLAEAQLLTELRDAEECCRRAASELEAAKYSRQFDWKVRLDEAKTFEASQEQRRSDAEDAIEQYLKGLGPESFIAHRHATGVDAARLVNGRLVITTLPPKDTK